MKLILGLSGVCIATISMIAFLGHVLDVDGLFQWNNHAGMAINTSVGLFLCGLCLILISLHGKTHDGY